MSDTLHHAFFGDRERAFDLTPELILELERVTGTGIGALIRRVFATDYKQADLNETIRLGLIGGGASPEEAATLIKTYATGRPLAETFPLTVSILEALWFGKPAPKATTEPETEALTDA